MKRIVIASDSFKGSLSSQEVARAAAAGIGKVWPDCETVCMNIADGGEGTARTLTEALGGRMVRSGASDPLGRRISAEYGIVEADGRKTAVIEMSQASGLTLLTPDERNPLQTSTYGTGEMITDAIGRGCRRFMVGIGGSATNDGGCGMLEALGFRFMDKDGRIITGLCGGRLGDIASIDCSGVMEEVLESEFTVACDVDTVFSGPAGAAAVFGPQKGATPEAVAELEDGMQNLERIIRQNHGIDLSKVPGSGAAGGLGGAFKAFLGATLKRGIDMVLDAAGFDEAIKGADLIITGEGKIDDQTSQGKVISGIVKRAERQNIPVIAIAGIVDIENAEACGLTAVFPICERPQSKSDLEHAMRAEVASGNISETVAKALVSLSPSLFRETL